MGACFTRTWYWMSDENETIKNESEGTEINIVPHSMIHVDKSHLLPHIRTRSPIFLCILNFTTRNMTCAGGGKEGVRSQHCMIGDLEIIHNFLFDTLWQRHNDRCTPDDIFEYIFLNLNVKHSIKITLRFVPINNIPVLVQIMAWRRPGGKPFSEPMMVNSLTLVCVTQLQWVNISKFNQIFLTLYLR